MCYSEELGTSKPKIRFFIQQRDLRTIPTITSYFIVWNWEVEFLWLWTMLSFIVEAGALFHLSYRKSKWGTVVREREYGKREIKVKIGRPMKKKCVWRENQHNTKRVSRLKFSTSEKRENLIVSTVSMKKKLTNSNSKWTERRTKVWITYSKE